MLSPIGLLIIVNTVVLVLGAIMAGLAYRAYRRSRDSSLGALALGIGLVTIGTAVGGMLHQVFEMELIAGILVQNVSIAAGFFILIYSLFIPTHVDGPSSPTSDRSL